MTKRMKTNATRKNSPRNDALEILPIEKIAPDISTAVESICTRLNTIIISVKGQIQKLQSNDYSSGNINAEAFNSFINGMEKSLEFARTSYIAFNSQCKELLGQGWKISTFARTCLHNVDQSTKNALIDFEDARSAALLKFYSTASDASIKSKRAPRFGGSSRADIHAHISG